MAAVVDTGSTDALTLLPSDIALIDLPYQGSECIILADGEAVPMNVFFGVVIWDGFPLPCRILASNGGALVGMRLLKGHWLMLDARVDGDVLIYPIPSSPAIP